MSSASGGSGISGGTRSFEVLDGGNVQLPNGAQVDLKTADGVALAKAQLSPEQLSELEVSMASAGFKLVGNAFVPRDSYELRQELGVAGPTATQAGLSDSDKELIDKAFVQNGIPSPYNANTTEKYAAQVRGAPEFTATVKASTNFFANPTAANKDDVIGNMKAVQAKYPNGNVMELMFLVFRESIKETNEDKKYFLIKLQDFNSMAEGVSDYLSTLVQDSQKMSEQGNGQKYPEKVSIPVTVKTFDLTGLDPNGKLHELSSHSKSLDRAGLNDTIKDVESMQETVRNKRQMASTAFQNFDQKATQLYNLMASLLKTVNEMRGIGAASRSGL
jgi:hypothetical protein